MSDEVMLGEFPDNDQRVAVCQTQWSNKSSKEVVRKIAFSEGDGLEFVLSDGSLDRGGDRVEPNGWDLRSFRKNPIALFNHLSSFPIGTWSDVRVEGGKLLGKLNLAAPGTSSRIDELVSLVKQGILRAVSVGFRPLESEPLKGADFGRRYVKQELLECSLVSVPANASALAVAKSMNISDGTLDLAFGEHAVPGQVIKSHRVPGEHAASLNATRKSKTMVVSLSQRIEDAQQELTKSKDALLELITQEPRDLDAEEELHNVIEVRERALANLKRSEAVLATKMEAVSAQAQPAQTRSIPAQPARRPFGVAGRDTRPGDAIVRAAAVHVVSFATGKEPEHVLEKMYGEDDGTAVVVRAAVAGATTTAVGWAAELVNTQMAEFLETLRPVSVYPALAAAGGGRLAFGPNAGAIRIPARAATPSIGGAFVGEGAPIPVRRLGLSTVTLTPRKMGVISVFSREIARYSVQAIEALIRQEIIADTAVTLDSLLLDSAPADTVRPAGLLAGVTPIAGTAGGTYAAILADFRALRAPFDTLNAGNGLMVLMNPAQMEALNMTPGADGTLGWAQAIMDRYQIVTSTAIPVGDVIMLRATDFVTATGDAPEFELSNDATIHMEDTNPAMIGTAGTPTVVAAPVASMFQTAQISIRMLLDVSWAMRRAGMVRAVTGVTW